MAQLPQSEHPEGEEMHEVNAPGAPDEAPSPSNRNRLPSSAFLSTDDASPGGLRDLGLRSMDGRSSVKSGATHRREREEIPVDFVMEKLNFKVDSTQLYIDLLIFIPFLIMFIFFFLGGRDIENNFYVLKAVRDRMMFSEFPDTAENLDIFRSSILAEEDINIELDKTYFDIGNAQDWGWFMKFSVMPRIWDCANKDATHQVLMPTGQNIHIGALRVREIRMDPYSCEVEGDRYGSMNRTIIRDTCYKRHDRQREQVSSPRCNITNPLTGDQMYEYRHCDAVPGAFVNAIEEVYHCGGYMFEVPFNESCNSVTPIMDLLGNDNSGCNFADNWATRFVVIEFFIYSPQTDAFHSVKLFHEVFVGGWWYNQYSFRTFQVWTDRRLSQTIFDFFFFAFVLYYWVDFFHDLIQVIRETGSFVRFFVEFWNWLELANLITFLVVFIFRWIWWNDSVQSKPQFPFDAHYPSDLDRIRVESDIQIYANSVNTILTFVKLLKYVRLNDRLNVLTRTISMCQQSIFGVLVLFVFVLVGYGITAWTLFGINMEGFRNLGISMSTLMRMLVGDIDYESMKRENRYLAGAFFWTWTILALFLLLNFLIAIISESFAKISGKAHVQPLDEVLVRTLAEWKAYFTPHHIKRMVGLKLRGRSSDKLLKLALEDIRIVRDNDLARRHEEKLLRMKSMEEAGEEMQMLDEDDEYEFKMKRSDWDEWVRRDVMDDLGSYYFDITWEELHNEYAEHKKSSEAVDRREMQETVYNGVMKVVAPSGQESELEKVSQFNKILTNLENEVARIMSAQAANTKMH